ncbi:MAG: hypothetical protein P8X57_14560 [Cyclobacteriaceae bacterium]
MKTSVKIFALIFVMFCSTAATAFTDPVEKPSSKTTAGETSIKLLPSIETGKIKVLYVNDSERKVTVRLHGDTNFVDKVKMNPSDKGFIKTYDLSQLASGIYWIEIEDSRLTISYEIEKREDGTIFASYWKQFMPADERPSVASL